jgi:7,8-dihydro-6-hydroxymethylpterin-pyrophosphokinase
VRSADRNAPRTVDVDISIFGCRVVEDPEAELVIPDPEILTRAHVAVPLADLAPDLPHPVTGERLADIAARLESASSLRVHPRLRLDP